MQAVRLERSELAVVLDRLFVVSRPESHPGQQAQVGRPRTLGTERREQRVDVCFRDGAAEHPSQATVASEDEGGRERSLIVGAEESLHDAVVPASYHTRKGTAQGLVNPPPGVSPEAERFAVALAILRSRESDTDEVQALFGLFLHRGADPGGLATFVNALQAGESNETVEAAILGSDEYFANLGKGR